MSVGQIGRAPKLADFRVEVRHLRVRTLAALVPTLVEDVSQHCIQGCSKGVGPSGHHSAACRIAARAWAFRVTTVLQARGRRSRSRSN
eukprot:529056-Alexandrium_andersonii.AAC.1